MISVTTNIMHTRNVENTIIVFTVKL